MIAPDFKVKRMLETGELAIVPFDPKCLNPAGYDLRSAFPLVIKPGEQKLVSTLERVELPPTAAGLLHLRSSFAREGLFASLALVDPGFKGQLTITLFNAGSEPVEISRGEPFVQITFVSLQGRAKRPYAGRYQGSAGVVESLRRPKTE